MYVPPNYVVRVRTLGTVLIVVRLDYSVINVGIQYSTVRFECNYCAGFCFVGKYVDCMSTLRPPESGHISIEKYGFGRAQR